ncbi:MAG TPA: hypothetical protein VE777_17915 [Gaiellales bacterium]|jgi:hypothetical protein|nr:hypothetical protein [Gaiellales bacterium]
MRFFQKLAGARHAESAPRRPLAESLAADPDIHELGRALNDALFDEAAGRFADTLRRGVTVRLEIAEAVGLIAARAVDTAMGDEHFRAAREVVIAGYAWRLSELEPEVALVRAEDGNAPAEPPARASYRALAAERPMQSPLLLVADAAVASVTMSLHEHSPGGAVYGSRFLERGASLVRETLPAAARVTDAEFDTLFLSGLCLRDAEPALPAAAAAERVQVGVTSAGAASTAI